MRPAARGPRGSRYGGRCHPESKVMVDAAGGTWPERQSARRSVHTESKVMVDAAGGTGAERQSVRRSVHTESKVMVDAARGTGLTAAGRSAGEEEL